MQYSIGFLFLTGYCFVCFLGHWQVLNSHTEEVYKKVMDATQCKGAYAAIDPVCGEMTKMLAHCTRNKGRVLVFGNLCEGDMVLSPHDLIFRYYYTSTLVLHSAAPATLRK